MLAPRVVQRCVLCGGFRVERGLNLRRHWKLIRTRPGCHHEWRKAKKRELVGVRGEIYT